MCEEENKNVEVILTTQSRRGLGIDTQDEVLARGPDLTTAKAAGEGREVTRHEGRPDLTAAETAGKETQATWHGGRPEMATTEPPAEGKK